MTNRQKMTQEEREREREIEREGGRRQNLGIDY